MRNAYGGDCYRCKLWVRPGTGHFERKRGGWRVRHHDYTDAKGAVTCEMARAATHPKSVTSTEARS